jgi:uncharacterized protein YbjT (DUF2867 family)
MPAERRSALILGATGVVGRHCLDALLADDRYERVVSIGRRRTSKVHTKLHEIETPLEQLQNLAASDLGRIDDAFCCLGTTQAKAGSSAVFRQIEVEYPRHAARLAKACGANQFLIVTAIGAEARSPIFYNKVKGEVEAAVIAEGIASTSIFRPSLLLGHRDEFRWKEKLGEPFMRLLGRVMIGPARRLSPIKAAVVAGVMVRVAANPKPGVTVYSSDRIADIGHGLAP